MVDRIASFVQTSKLINNNLSIQAKYAEGQIQLSSGFKSDTYQGIAKDTNKLLNLESEFARIQTQTENAQTALDRSESAFDSYGSIITVGQAFITDLRAAINGIAPPSEIQTIAQNNLNQTASILNTTVAGRFIFGGSVTTSPPVDLNDPGFGGAVPPSAANTNYYQGNSFTQSVEIADNFTVNYGVKADDPALEQIIRAYDLVRTNPANQAALTEALSLLESGLDDLAVSKANISQHSQTFDRRITENQEQLTLIESMISNVRDVDLAEVSIRLQEFEAQLQASYAVTTNLLQLKITDYI
jgi:flagellar hook-associated protein 3 FlgL